MSSVAHKLMTAEEYWQSPMNTKHSELVRGEVIEVMPPGGRHAEIAGAVMTLLRLWIKQGIGGFAGVEAGYVLSHDPDSVRAPDVSYVRAERIPKNGVPEAFWHLAPDLAVEVISPSETADDIRAKVRDFLAAGTPLVWTIYPRTREVVVYTPDGLARTYSEADMLEDPDVLPGFSCKVAELFT